MNLPVRSHFSFARTYMNFNHGSFGAVPSLVQARASDIRQQQQARPDRFFRESLRNDSLVRSRDALATFVACDSRELVFVESASFAINTLLRSLVISRSQNPNPPVMHILITDSAYMMVQNTLRYMKDNIPWINIIVIPLREKFVKACDVWKYELLPYISIAYRYVLGSS
jgi:selenocysteine lyase/cysteine desulfurase